jgi:hypothetical protein
MQDANSGAAHDEPENLAEVPNSFAILRVRYQFYLFFCSDSFSISYLF